MYYGIKISKSGRYITYCDKCWYETNKGPIFLFTKDQAKAIAEQMRNHYVYEVDIVGEDGTEEHVGRIKTNPMKESTGVVATVGNISITL